MDDSLEEFVVRARRGDSRAFDVFDVFDVIVRQHPRLAYAAALAALQRPTDAEGVARRGRRRLRDDLEAGDTRGNRGRTEDLGGDVTTAPVQARRKLRADLDSLNEDVDHE